MFVNHISDKGPISRINKGFSKLYNKYKQIIPLEHRQRHVTHWWWNYKMGQLLWEN